MAFTNRNSRHKSSRRRIRSCCCAQVPRHIIVHLEPGKGNPLRRPLTRFRTMAAKMYGYTDAHAYHPHATVTGFWELDPSICKRDLKALTNAIDKLVKTASGMAKVEVRPPHLRGMLLSLPTRPSAKISNLTHSIFNLFNSTELFKTKGRRKKTDHISLAYFKDARRLTRQKQETAFEGMTQLARALLGDVLVGSKPVQIGHWDIVLYESIIQAKQPLDGDVNVFRTIKRWQL